MTNCTLWEIREETAHVRVRRQANVAGAKHGRRRNRGAGKAVKATVRSLDCVISTVLSRGVTQSTYFSKTSVNSVETDCRRAEGQKAGALVRGQVRNNGDMARMLETERQVDMMYLAVRGDRTAMEWTRGVTGKEEELKSPRSSLA